MKKPRSKCLRPACTRPDVVRGLCDPCYQAAHRLVATKRITWEELEKQGKVRPPVHLPGHPPSPIQDWFMGKGDKK